ncbi:MAG: rhamnogalacturonan acetylesterase [Acidobacteriaceae bacterium]
MLGSGAALAQTARRFVCDAGKNNGHGVALSTTSIYDEAGKASDTLPAYGFDLNTAPEQITGRSCSSDKLFFFSVAAHDGNYRVTLVLGGPDASTNTVKAESRRLFVDQMAVPARGSRRIVFNVNVHTPEIVAAKDVPDAAGPVVMVRLKPREIGVLDWDHKLTLEFNGDHPSVRSISIEAVENVPTLYIAGDSTVVDQTKEPWAAWGQILPLFFGPKISIANEAESGETIRSFVSERRLEKVMSTIKPGDYLMLQFGHNDQKPGKGYVPAATDFKTYLLQYIHEVRAHGATPILVTPMNRRNFDASGKIIQTLGEYPQAMREVAQQQHVALIDLNALSKTLFDAMGVDGTLHAFVHYPTNTFPDQSEALADNTHFNAYGAYELARTIVQSIQDQKLPLARYLRRPVARFDPAHPDPFSAWTLPPSPAYTAEKPYER